MSHPDEGPDPEATQLRPRASRPRTNAVPTGVWDNVAAWTTEASAQSGPSAESSESSDQPQRHREPRDQPHRPQTQSRPGPSRGGPPAARLRTDRTRTIAGPRRRAAPRRPAAGSAPADERRSRLGLLMVITAVVAALAMIIPTWLASSESTTSRAVTVAHGPLPRRAEAAKLPTEVIEHRRVAASDQSRQPWGQVDLAVYADAAGVKKVTVLTQKLAIGSLEELDQRRGMQARRFGRVSCGQRYDAQECTMLLEGGTLTASTIDPAWQLEELAGFLRQVYVRLP